MTNKNIVIGVMIVISAVLIVAFYSTTGDADNKLRVGHVPVSSSMLTFTMLDQRYLEEEGFQVEITRFQTSIQLAEAVANGQVDLGGTVASCFRNFAKRSGRLQNPRNVDIEKGKSFHLHNSKERLRC